MRYEVSVEREICQSVKYIIDAESSDEAREKAMSVFNSTPTTHRPWVLEGYAFDGGYAIEVNGEPMPEGRVAYTILK